MMANVEVGSAYVTIMPKVDKGFGSKLGSSIEGGLSAKAVALGNIMSDIAKKAASVAVDGAKAVIGGAMSNFAEYEQLTGGVETLFKDSAGIVEEYAQNAYATAGLSANEYMKTVTGFSASLLQSVGNDTAKAAEYANTAVTDMSDNANKMGSSMEDIQNAYQGFAKQNYTMLDNLKLGYGGTKGEMQRLIADANKLREAQGKNADLTIESYADVVEAIHTVQAEMGISGYSVDELNAKLRDMALTDDELQKVADDMGISFDEAMRRMKDGTLTASDAQALLGTTAKEAATTIEGSVNAMKGAWSNWLTALAADDLDLGEKTQQLIDSVVTVGKNVLPRLAKVAGTLVAELPGMVAQVGAALPGAVGPLKDALAQALESAFGPGAAQAMDGVASIIGSAVGTVAGAVRELAPAMAPILGIVASLVQAVQANMPVIQGYIASVVGTLKGVISAVLPVVTEVFTNVLSTATTVLPTVVSLIQGALGMVMGVVNAAMPVIQGIISAAWPVISSVIDAALSMASQIAPVVMDIMGTVMEAMPAIGTVVESVMGLIGSVTSTVLPVVQGIFSAVWPAISGIVRTAVGVIVGVIKGIASVIATVRGIFEGIRQAITSPIEIAKGIVGNVVGAIKALFSGLSGAVATVRGIFEGIRQAITSPIEAARNAIRGIIDGITGLFSGLKLELPRFALPHFRIDGGELPWGIGGQGRAPTIGVEWYAKGGFVDGATLIGAGERGAEMILPRRGRMMDDFALAVAQESGQGEEVVRWLESRLGPTIERYAPSATPREWARAVRSV